MYEGVRRFIFTAQYYGPHVQRVQITAAILMSKVLCQFTRVEDLALHIPPLIC